MMLLFPDPFGPDMTVNPSKNGIRVFLEKDLKLSISTWTMCTAALRYFSLVSVLRFPDDVHAYYECYLISTESSSSASMTALDSARMADERDR